ncbi:MAG: hypothetical protein HOE90_23550 [Bacteriovoracaceae bacterium]|jgi:hypothetical protein|nr:hypothetical protein [Bacteriovoracaceae bacterium]
MKKNFTLIGLSSLMAFPLFSAEVSADEEAALFRQIIHQAHANLEVGQTSTYRSAVKGLNNAYPECWLEVKRESTVKSISRTDYGGYVNRLETIVPSKLALGTEVAEVDSDNSTQECQGMQFIGVPSSYEVDEQLLAIDHSWILGKYGFELTKGLSISSNKDGQMVLTYKNEKGEVDLNPSHLVPYSLRIPGKVYTLN